MKCNWRNSENIYLAENSLWMYLIQLCWDWVSLGFRTRYHIGRRFISQSNSGKFTDVYDALTFKLWLYAGNHKQFPSIHYTCEIFVCAESRKSEVFAPPFPGSSVLYDVGHSYFPVATFFIMYSNRCFKRVSLLAKVVVYWFHGLNYFYCTLFIG